MRQRLLFGFQPYLPTLHPREGLRAVDLFAGGGGVALALHHLRIPTTHVELDPEACATLTAAGFTDVHEADVRTWRGLEGERVPFLWASPPCQPWSSAGKKLGTRDRRNLWPATLEQIDRLRPEVAVCENVPGLTHHDGKGGCGDVRTCSGCYFERWLVPEWKKRFPWTGVWTLNAVDYGTPQTRERVFLVGAPTVRHPPIPTHRDPAHVDDPRPPWTSIAQALGLQGADVFGAGSNPHGKGRQHERVDRLITDEPAPTMAADMGNNRPWVLEGNQWTDLEGDSKGRKQGGVVRGPQTRRVDQPALAISTVPGHLRRDVVALTGHNTDRQGERVPHEVSVDRPSPTIRARGDHGGAPLSLEERPDWWHRSSDDDGPSRAIGTRGNASVNLRPSPTVSTTAGGRGGKGTDWATDLLEEHRQRRTLTVEEVGILQDFPGDYPWQGSTKSARYKQAGNAVPWHLAYAVTAAALDIL